MQNSVFTFWICCSVASEYQTIAPEIFCWQAPTTLRGKTCGMCGDFNGEITHEYEGPDMTIYKKPEDFAKRYVIPSRSCETPTSLAQDSSMSIEEPGTANPPSLVCYIVLQENKIWIKFVHDCYVTVTVDTEAI